MSITYVFLHIDNKSSRYVDAFIDRSLLRWVITYYTHKLIKIHNEVNLNKLKSCLGNQIQKS